MWYSENLGKRKVFLLMFFSSIQEMARDIENYLSKYGNNQDMQTKHKSLKIVKHFVWNEMNLSKFFTAFSLSLYLLS